METIETLKLVLLKSNFNELSNALKSYNISEQDEYGNNILHYYIKTANSLDLNYKGVIDLLVSKGIDIDERQNRGKFRRAPLHLAILDKLRDIATYLIELGADVNLQDFHGNTPLCDATLKYNGEDDFFIKLLMKNGADSDLENNYGVSARILANTIASSDVKKFFA